jgi:hypothetical protein
MRRERALKVVLVLVGLLFTAGVYLWLTKTLHRHSVHAIPRQDTDLPISWRRGIESMTRLADARVSHDAVQTRRSAALSAIGSLGDFRRRVVRSGGVVHRPDAEPRLARFQAVESGAAPARLFPATSAFGICDSSQNRQRGSA